MKLYLAGETRELLAAGTELLGACVDYAFDRPFPTDLPPMPGGAMLLGGALSARRAGEIAEECRARDLTAALAGFGDATPLEALRFCDALLRRSVIPILTESAWQPGCGGERLLSTAMAAGDLGARLEKAQRESPDLCLDVEKLCRAYPLIGESGEGAPLSPRELNALLGRGAKPEFSRELMCKVLHTEFRGEPRRVLFDDGETLREKLKLAASLGVKRAFLLYPEWSAREAAAAREALSGK